MDARNADLCRICLGQNGLLESIFKVVEGLDTDLSLAQIICSSISSSVHITQNDGFFDKICSCCSQKVLDFHKFKIKIEGTELMLKTKRNIELSEQENLNLNIKSETDCESSNEYEETEITIEFGSVKVEVIQEDIISSGNISENDEDTIEVENEYRCELRKLSSIHTEVDLSIKEEIDEYEGEDLNIHLSEGDSSEIHKISSENNPEDSTKIKNGYRRDLEKLSLIPTEVVWSIKEEMLDDESINEYEIEDCEVLGNQSGIINAELMLKERSSEKGVKYSYENKFEDKVESGYMEHKLIHDGNNPLESEPCNKNHSDEKIDCRHLLSHNKVMSSHKELRNNSILQSYLLLHSSEKSFECKICNKQYIKKSNLKRHLLNHTGEKLFECEHCHRKFANKGNLNTHILTHSHKESFECQICNKKFNQKRYLGQHLLSHTDEKLFECEVCHKKFARKTRLQSHLFIHSDKKPFKCEFCDKDFIKENHLQSHLLLHSGKTPIECKICNKPFVKKDNLKKHLLTHTGERLFECEHCHIKFVHKGNLNSHLLTHSDNKTFECSICNKKFGQNRYLKIHLLSHTTDEEKLFECEHCHKKFIQKGALRRHLVVHYDKIKT